MEPGATSLDRLLPEYPVELAAVFEDRRGREDIVISNDGHVLRTSIRGVSLGGPTFDALEAAMPGPDQPLEFDEYGCLAAGTLEVSLSVPATVAGEARRVPLAARIDLSSRSRPVELAIKLADGRGPFRGTRHGGDFEAELEDIAGQLPPDARLVCCYTCGLSDYSPSGQQSFGDLGCFRDTSAAYREVESKWDLFALWPSITESVQETHLCPQWEARPAGRGYRG